MKFTCSTKDIAFAVNAAGKIINGHATVPILANILITGDHSEIRVRATDLELTLERSLPAEVHEHGAVTVPAKLLAGFLSNLPPGLFELTGSPTRASIRAERSSYDFHALPADEYPPLPNSTAGESFLVNAQTFREGVQATIFAASNEEARGAVLMGTLLEVDPALSTLSLVATDGFRLARWSAALAAPFSGSPVRYIVPARALAEAARNAISAEVIEFSALGLATNSGSIGAVSSHQLAMKADVTMLVVRLVNGQYPNYQQVVPVKFDRRVVVNTDSLVAALRRAEIMSRDRVSLVKLEIEDGELTILANSDVVGSAREEILVDQTGKGITVAFNARFLVEILNHIDSPQTALEFLGPLSPMRISPVVAAGSGDAFYVLMPLRQ